ncbi:TPA: YfhO family protein [Enterococcus faecium]
MKKLLKKDAFTYYSILSICLWVVIVSLYMWWPIAGKAPVELWDGQSQHFVSFVYFGEYIREIIKNILIDHNFSIPTYDFSIGYGQDILGTLHYYIIGDPFSLLAVFAKPKYAEFAFSLAIMLRIFFSGISISIFLRYKKMANYQTFIATFIYVFSGFTLSSAWKHPYFINPMIYLPLLCLGLEYIFEKRGYKLFTFMIFISVISNFYFFYMLSILIFLYAVYRYFELYTLKDYKVLFSLLFKSIGSYVLGIMMGSVIFIPVINQFFNAGRGEIHSTLLPFYTKSFYLNFVKNFISPVYGGEATTVTAFFPIIIFVLSVILYRSKQKNNFARLDLLAISLLTIFLFFPFFGSLFNGFSYSTNRWMFGYAFFWAFLTAKYLPVLVESATDLSKRKRFVHISSIVFFFFILFTFANYKRNVPPYIGLIFLLLYSTIFLLFANSKKTKIALSILVFLNALVYGAFQTNIKINPLIINSYTDKNIVENDYWAPKSSAISDIINKDTDWSRYELSKTGNPRSEENNALLRGINSTNFYFSLANKNIFSFNKSIENNINSDYEYYGLDSRAELGTLANSKYYAKLKTDTNQDIPFGYTYLQTINKNGQDVEIYQNTNFLPFGYTYDSYIKQNDTQTSSLAIMDSMTKSVIINKDISGLKKNQITDKGIKKLNDHIQQTDGVEIKGNQYIVSKNNATVTFSVDAPSDLTNNYLFLRFKGINYPNTQPGLFLPTETATYLKVTYGQLSKEFNFRNQYQGWYVGIKNSLLNLGTVQPNQTIQVSFRNQGVYTFDSIELYTRDYSQLSTEIAKLRENTLQNVHFSANEVSGELNLEKEKLLLLTIPYEKGWTAYDNGKKIPIIQSNYMYTGLLLNPGNHQIKLIYHTPGLTTGWILTIVGWIIFLFTIILKKRFSFK